MTREQQIRVGAGRHRLEEVTGDALRAVGDTGGGERALGAAERRWTVEQDRAQPWHGAQDRAEQHAVAAADVDQVAAPR